MSLTLLRVGRFVAVLAILATTAWLVVQPAFADTSKYGWNDWDSHAAYRYITTLAIVKYNTLPWWNPYFCGGFPGWAYVEGATNLVSPYFPFYLFLSTGWALRVEMLGSTALGCVSTYLLAGRFSQSVSLRTLVTVLYALNGRWALQLAEGHTWHLQYAWLPLAVYLFDRGIVERRPRFAVACGLVMALMVYMGAIYPLPHTGLILIAYALLSVVALQRSAPVGHLVIAGLVSLGFAAPKLLPMLDLMLRTPRTVDSPEAIELSQLLVMFTARFQNFYTRPVPVPAWEWHEWGIYIGWSGVVLLACGFMLGADRRQSVVRAIGILLLLLGLGSFHPYAPWTLLHRLPPFTSQHVPSRFHYPAVLFLSLAGIAVLDRLLDRAIGLQRRPWVDLALLLPVALIGLDVGLVGREAMRIAFVHDIPKLQANISPAFEQLAQTPLHYEPLERHDSMLLSMFANKGTLACYGIPEVPSRGAIAKGDPLYRGEVYFAEGTGELTTHSWSTNGVTAEVRNASPGSVVVLNMNWDPSWRVNNAFAEEYKGAPAVRVEGNRTVHFHYYPRLLNAGLWLLVLAVAGVLVVPLAFRRRRGS